MEDLLNQLYLNVFHNEHILQSGHIIRMINWFGFGIQPSSKAVIGSLTVPYIYEDRISQKDFHATLKKALNVNSKTYKKMSLQGREHVRKNYNFDQYEKRWVQKMDEIVEKYGGWGARSDYPRWHLLEVA